MVPICRHRAITFTAQRHVAILAPGLQQIGEYWPGAAHKVRLPGGKYVLPGFAAWCTLADAAGTVLATDGASAARVLLNFQTPATVVPTFPPEMSRALHGPELVGVPNRQEQEAERKERSFGQVDSRWYEKYSHSLWFQFTPGQLATLYNERHPLPELLPLERSGMAFSPSVEERTPSTAITKDGLGWVDFSARTRHPNGTHDGGDALELVARRNGETKTHKRGTMQEAARAVVREAKAALEEAAGEGMPPPSWVASIMTEAGWQHYQRLRAGGRRQDQTTVAPSRRDSGVHQARVTNEAPQQRAEQGRAPFATAPSGAAHAAKPGRDSPEALAAEIGAEIGEPCHRCGCNLFYRSGLYRLCHWCLPRPARFGRLSDEQRTRLRAFLPRSR